MKNKILRSLMSVLCLALLFTSCKKDSKADEVTTDAQIAAHADDDAMVAEEVDAISADATVLLEENAAFSGDDLVLEPLVCGASVSFNSQANPRTITITYDGSNCQETRTRTGVVVFSMAQGTEWKNAGAAVTVAFTNLKITRNSDEKTITLNGAQTYTNVSGGLMYELSDIESIIHTITSSSLSVSFDNGTARTWSVARQREFTYNNGVVITNTGLHTEGNVTNIAEWGINRFGNAFTTSIVSPIVVKQECEFRVTGGQVNHTTPAYSATATFGLDASGEATTCPGEGHFYYELEWTRNNGNSFDVILPY